MEYLSNGDKFEGEFTQNKKNGIGIYYFRNRGKYIGNFKNNNINGLGTYHILFH